jgi:hypothetical protein
MSWSETMEERPDQNGVVLTDEQKRARRVRSIAIALSLAALVLLFYFVTLVKGPGVLHRPL